MAIMTKAEQQEYIARLENTAARLRAAQAEAYAARKGAQVRVLGKKLVRVYREIDVYKKTWGIR